MVVSSQQIEALNLLGSQYRFNIMSSKRNHTQMTNYSTVGITVDVFVKPYMAIDM